MTHLLCRLFGHKSVNIHHGKWLCLRCKTGSFKMPTEKEANEFFQKEVHLNENCHN